ncbi:MAG: hypothetical protein ACQEQV_07230 [Fibrobacterota bacterium]
MEQDRHKQHSMKRDFALFRSIVQKEFLRLNREITALQTRVRHLEESGHHHDSGVEVEAFQTFSDRDVIRSGGSTQQQRRDLSRRDRRYH